MVFFVCGACGGSFKKKQATMHTFRCSNWAFSCMDCGKDFSGHSFAEHNQCITESEKYHGDAHTPKLTQDKNALWMQKLKMHLAKQQTKPFLSKLIAKMLEMPSIPRKEPKFKNFVRTNMNISNDQIIQNLWELVSGVNAVESGQNSNGIAANKENATEQNRSSNGNLERLDENLGKSSVLSEQSPKKSKKRKASSQEDSPAVTDADNELAEEAEEEQPRESKSKRRKKNKLRQSATDEPDDSAAYRSGVSAMESHTQMEDLAIDTVAGIKKFKWRSTMKRILRSGPPEGMKVSKLLNKIEQEYNNPVSGVAVPMSKDEIRSIVMKTLNKKPFSVANQRAKVGKFASAADDE